MYYAWSAFPGSAETDVESNGN